MVKSDENIQKLFCTPDRNPNFILWSINTRCEDINVVFIIMIVRRICLLKNKSLLATS